MTLSEWDGVDPRVGVVVSGDFAMGVLKAADALHKAASDVIAQSRPLTKWSETPGYIEVPDPLVDALDVVCDAYRKAKEKPDA